MDARVRAKIRKMKLSKGQAIVEYIIIIAIVAVAALTVLSIFSDRVRELIAGVASSLGSNNASSAVDNSSIDVVKGMDKNGVEF